HDGSCHVLITHEDVTGRKLDEMRVEEVGAVNDFARSMVRFGAWQYDVASRAVVWSGDTARIHGVPEGTSPTMEEAVAFCAAEWRRHLLEVFSASIRDASAIDEEFEIVTAQGERVWVRCVGLPECDESGMVVRLRGAFLDTSARRMAEAQAAKVAARLVRTLERVKDAFVALDASLAFSYVNTHAERLLQRPREELIGRNIWETFPKAVGTKFEEKCIEAIRTDQPVEFVALYPPLGLWLEVRAFPSDGELSVYFRDVTKRRAAQIALEHSEQSLRLAIRASGLGTWSWDKECNKVFWSDECARMFGAEPGGSIRYRDFLALLDPGQRNHKDSVLRDALRRQREFRVEVRIPGPQGQGRWLSILGRVFPGGQEYGGSMQGVVLDITAQKDAEGELRRHNEQLERSVGRRTAELEKATLEAESANRAKSAFLAAMSHEIRTPMNGVLGMVEVLAQSELGSRQSEALKTIHDSANNLLRLIDDILDFSRIEAGRLKIDMQATSLEEVAVSVCGTLNAEAIAKNVTVNLYVSPALPALVMADPLRLRQVFFNLLGNAIKFSGGRAQRGLVHFSIEADLADPNWVMVSVEDNGIGISEAVMGQLFQVFTQAEASTTRRFGGTGLGLAICKQLVDLMGGSLVADSELDKGSAFRARLPTEPAAQQPATGTVRLDAIQYLVVEDQNYEARDIASYLTHAGAKVIRVRSVQDALAYHQAGKQQVLVYGSDFRARNSLGNPDAQAASEVFRRLVLARGSRHRVRRLSDTLVVLDAATLRRHALVEAAAMAAGLVSHASIDVQERKEPILQLHTASADVIERMSKLPILIAEDDLTNQKVILHQLELLGYRADVTGDGEEALLRWSENRYSLLLTDLHMPHRDGFSLASEIRRRELPGQRIPIVMLTANAILPEHNAAHPDIDDYLVKPTTLAALGDAIEAGIQLAAGSLEHRSDAEAGTDTGATCARILDLDVLRQLVGDDAVVHGEVLEAYRLSLHQATYELQSCSLRGDMAAVAGVAHRIKSSSRAVGASLFGELCAELEKASLVSDWHLVQDLIVLFLKDVDPLLAELEMPASTR
ncbi:MAG: ATP-binding protein, partial [Pseudoxanthomonas sp.]